MSQKTKEKYKIFLQWYGLINLIMLVPTLYYSWHLSKLIDLCLNK
jgi:hypothetical protein